MVKRQARESIEAQKHQMIAALYANPAYDQAEGKDGAKSGTEIRQERIRDLEKSFNRAIEIIYNPALAVKKEDEIDWNSPFWSAARRSQQRMIEYQKGLISSPDAPVQQVLEAHSSPNV